MSPKTIVLQPDGPALLAERLVNRLLRDRLIESGTSVRIQERIESFVEALADEIHQHAVESTIRGGR